MVLAKGCSGGKKSKIFFDLILLQLPTKHRPKNTHSNNEWTFIINYIFFSYAIKKIIF